MFLGAAPAAVASPAPLLASGAPLEPGAVLPLVRVRSPWREEGDVERVIVGSHASRADLRLEGEGIRAEHVRLYFPRTAAAASTAEASSAAADILALHAGSTRVEGRAVGPGEWTALTGGEVIELAGWRFRYEAGEAEGGAKG